MVYQFKKLIVWQQAMELTVSVHHLTKLFPGEDNSGLSIQLNQVATSVPILIAQGSKFNNKQELSQYLARAETALYELLTLLYLAAKLEYVNGDCLQQMEANIGKISQLLQSLINYSSKKNNE